MTVYEYFRQHEAFFRTLNRNGINPAYAAYVEAYGDYLRMVGGGCPRSVAALETADRMRLSERQFYNVVKKMETVIDG